MKKEKRLIFIGPLRLGATHRGGDTMKNNLFLKRFKEVFDKVYVVDTIDWNRHPLTILKLMYYLLFLRKAKVVVSCEQGASRIIDFLYCFRVQKEVYYWVVGSGFPTRIANGTISPKHYAFLKKILVQSPRMVESLQKAGLSNAMYIPNSKPIYNILLQDRKESQFKFVFISRILPEKGIDFIFNCLSKLNNEGYKDFVSIDFYGMIDEKYTSFKQKIDNFHNAYYKGLLNLTNIEGYKTLASYDVMLFPTFYEGEGFPGVFIDAFIAGLPVLTTNWHFNDEVIQDGVTGFIIPPKDEVALYDKMVWILKNKDVVFQMRQDCQKEAEKYNSENVLSVEKLTSIGLLDEE